MGAIVITHDVRKGWINRLAVDSEHRRKGYATELLEVAENDFRAMSIRIFAALIEADKAASREFFARSGYKTHDVVYLTKRQSEDV